MRGSVVFEYVSLKMVWLGRMVATLRSICCKMDRDDIGTRLVGCLGMMREI